MSNQELSTEISPEIINSLILTGDMSKLTAGQQTQYYTAVCKDLGLNPLTQPFAIITLQGKKTLYATKGCTQQLSNVRGISTEVKERKTNDSVYIVSVRATAKDGRFTDEDGIVGISGLKGTDLANAMLKAITKAKRRAVLALCGLGMSDESEVEDITHSNIKMDSGKSRVENIIDMQIEPEAVDFQKETEKLAPDVKENRKSTKDKPKSTISKPNNETLPKDHYQVIGIIEGIPKSGEMPNPFNDNKPGIKYNFTIEGKKYGTFDKKIVDEMMKVLDIQANSNPIMIKLEYKERKSGEKIFNDIVRFMQVTTDEVPI